MAGRETVRVISMMARAQRTTTPIRMAASVGGQTIDTGGTCCRAKNSALLIGVSLPVVTTPV